MILLRCKVCLTITKDSLSHPCRVQSMIRFELYPLSCLKIYVEPSLILNFFMFSINSGVEVPQNYFKEVLENIEKNRLLSPLLVVTTLSSCPTASLGVVRDYLLRTLRVEETNIQEDTRILEQYRRDTEALRETIHVLRY